MTAIDADFVKVVQVPSRKAAQIILEIPEERMDHVIAALGGYPTAAKALRVGVAPLSGDARYSEPPERKEMTLSQWAGMLCQVHQFQTFLVERCNGASVSERSAAGNVRFLCGVNSRSDIKEGTEAGKRWKALKTDYDEWCGRIPARS